MKRSAKPIRPPDGTAASRTARSFPGADALDTVALCGLILLLLLAPLPFGSVQKSATFGVAVWSAVLAWMVLAARPSLPFSPATRAGCAVLLCLSILACLQLLSFPREAADVLSPALVRLHGSNPINPADGDAHWFRLSVHPDATDEYVARLISLGSIFVVSMTLASRARASRAIFGAIFATGVFQAAYGSAEYLSGHQHIFAYAKRFYTDAATGTYINQNHFAGALEMSLLVGLGLTLGASPRRPSAGRPFSDWRARAISLLDGRGAPTAALATGTAVIGLGLVLSYSRMGLASAVLATAIFVLVDLYRHGRRASAGLALASILGGAVLLLITLVGWSRVTSDMIRQMQGLSWEEGRLRVWRDSLGIVHDFPLAGTGLGSFRTIYPAYKSERIAVLYDHAHNDYLQLLVETGLCGAAAAVLLLGLFWWTLLRGLNRYRGRDFTLIAGGAAGLGSLLLHETFDFNLQIPANAVLFSALAGAVLGSLRSPSLKDGDGAVAWPPPRRFLSRQTRDSRPFRGTGGGAIWTSRPGAARVIGTAFAIAASLASVRAYREYRGRVLLAQYQVSSEKVTDVSAQDRETAIRERMDRLHRALAQGSVTSEARVALALELVDSANAHVLAGHDDLRGGAVVRERLGQARDQVGLALAANPTHSKAWLAGYRVAESARMLGRTEIARGTGRTLAALSTEFTTGAARSDPNGGRLHHDLAVMKLAAGDRAGAFEAYRRSVRDPSIDVAGIAGEMIEAGYPAERILEAMPDRFPALYGVGRLLQSKGFPGEAQSALLRASRLYPSAHEAWTALSRLAEAQGRHEEALDYARRAFPLIPALRRTERSEILFCAAVASRSKGDVENAISYGVRALEENPRHLFLYNFVGSLLYERGNPTEAIRYWQTLIDRHGSDPYVRDNLAPFHRMIGGAYEKLGLRDRAVEHYLDALSASPDDREAKAALSRLSGS